jgi:hypothetical protein
MGPVAQVKWASFRVTAFAGPYSVADGGRHAGVGAKDMRGWGFKELRGEIVR